MRDMLRGWWPVLIVACMFMPAQAQDTAVDAAPAAKESKKSLADLLLSETERAMLQKRKPEIGEGAGELPKVDADVLRDLGIRRLESNHLILYTDLPSDPFVDEIPQVFDLAVAQWAEYFEIPEEKYKGWQVAGSLIRNKERFQTSQLLPLDLPPFLHGYSRGRQFWVYEQESPYYRRHLVLHEGVHGFMFDKLGGAGPPWYREGIAEFLATHKWKGGTLVVGYMPRSREEVPYWGRIRILRREYAGRRPLMLREVMRFSRDAHLKIEPYAWCWAAAAFLDGNLRYRSAFRKLKESVEDDSAFFTRDFETTLRGEAREIDEEWQLFVANMDYGYDFRRNAVRYQIGTQLEPEGRTVTVSTDLGWQSTGIRMEQGKNYTITSKGRFRVRQKPVDWWSEPGGITIQYENGMPLGVLLGNIRRDEPLPGAASLVNPIRIGLSRRVSAGGNGTLYLRINESADGLYDNSGQVSVHVAEQKGTVSRRKRPQSTRTSP